MNVLKLKIQKFEHFNALSIDLSFYQIIIDLNKYRFSVLFYRMDYPMDKIIYIHYICFHSQNFLHKKKILTEKITYHNFYLFPISFILRSVLLEYENI